MSESKKVDLKCGTLLDIQVGSRGKATTWELTVNLITCGLGTGVFTLPWSAAGSSVIPAILIVAVVLALNAWTINIIIEAGERHQTFDLGALLGKLPGRAGQVAEFALNASIWISSFLCLVGYIIVISDSFVSFLPFDVEILAAHRPRVVALAACAVLPLCFLDQSLLSLTSVVAVVATVNIFANLSTQLVYGVVEDTRPDVCYFGLSTGSVAMASAMMQTVVIQMNALPMYAELKDRTPAKFSRVVAVSFLALFLICTGFAVVGYLAYGQVVSSNVLLNLPDTIWGRGSRISAGFAVMAVYPIVIGPMLAPLRKMRTAMLPASVTNGLATMAIVVASMVSATICHDLGYVSVLNGALSCGVFATWAPVLVGLHLVGERSSRFRTVLRMLTLLGSFMAVLGVALTDNYTEDLQNACIWRSR